jgi:hypothetical protein
MVHPQAGGFGRLPLLSYHLGVREPSAPDTPSADPLHRIVLGLTPRPIMDYTKYTYGVAAGLLIAPLFPCVALDMPKRSPRLYQLVLFLAAWIFPSISIFDPVRQSFRLGIRG